MIVTWNETDTLKHDPLLDLLSELITRERDGATLYRRYLGDAPTTCTIRSSNMLP